MFSYVWYHHPHKQQHTGTWPLSMTLTPFLGHKRYDKDVASNYLSTTPGLLPDTAHCKPSCKELIYRISCSITKLSMQEHNVYHSIQSGEIGSLFRPAPSVTLHDYIGSLLVSTIPVLHHHHHTQLPPVPSRLHTHSIPEPRGPSLDMSVRLPRPLVLIFSVSSLHAPITITGRENWGNRQIRLFTSAGIIFSVHLAGLSDFRKRGRIGGWLLFLFFPQSLSVSLHTHTNTHTYTHTTSKSCPPSTYLWHLHEVTS